MMSFDRIWCVSQIFNTTAEGGEVHVHAVTAADFESFEHGPATILDVEAWNSHQIGKNHYLNPVGTSAALWKQAMDVLAPYTVALEIQRI